MPNCEKCNDTGIYETGNNDLPCDCPAGATALFNVTGVEGRVTGEKLILLHLTELCRNNSVSPKSIMHLDPDPFERMRSGTKLIETRLTVDKHRQPRTLKVGDVIFFVRSDSRTNVLVVKIAALLYYPSFASLADDFDPKRYFGRDSKEELLTNLRRRYSEADEREYGVLGIKVSVLNN
jgi:ASC-1-like (ASCH) protein